MENKVDKLQMHASSSMAYCKIPHKEKGVDLRHHLQFIAPQTHCIIQVNKANTNVDCSENMSSQGITYVTVIIQNR
jgi:hypothetical protein